MEQTANYNLNKPGEDDWVMPDPFNENSDIIDTTLRALQSGLTAHTENRNNPHGVTAAQIGADASGSAATVQTNLTAHTGNRNNPHGVTATQVGADASGSAAAVQVNLTAHTGSRNNPHGVTAAQAGADASGSAAAVQTNLTAHTGNQSNPHGVTAAQVGAITPASLEQNLPQYGTCATAAGTSTKAATVPNFILRQGAIVGILFSYANTATSPSLTINGSNSGAIYDYRTGTYPVPGVIGAGVHLFMRTGTQYRLLNPALGTQFAMGSYVGTGTSHSTSPTSITAPFPFNLLIVISEFVPVFIPAGAMAFRSAGLSGWSGDITLTWPTPTTPSWYTSGYNAPRDQMNVLNTTYPYFIFG